MGNKKDIDPYMDAKLENNLHLYPSYRGNEGGGVGSESHKVKYFLTCMLCSTIMSLTGDVKVI